MNNEIRKLNALFEKKERMMKNSEEAIKNICDTWIYTEDEQ